jgi:hypothetical protein
MWKVISVELIQFTTLFARNVENSKKSNLIKIYMSCRKCSSRFSMPSISKKSSIKSKETPKTYRNVYFKKGIPALRGSKVLFYTGRLIRNAGDMASYKKDFDRTKDYYFSCDCLNNVFSSLVKVSK